MLSTDSRMPLSRTAAAGRIAWTIVTLVVVQAVVCGVSAAPAVLMWQRVATAAESRPTLWWVLVSVAVVPTYVLFAVCLLIVSPLVMRLLRWYTPPDAELRIADLD